MRRSTPVREGNIPRPSDEDSTAAQDVGARSGVVWWLSPIGALALVTVPMLILAWLLSDGTYRSEWKVAKAVSGSTVWLLLVGVVAFAIGTLWPQFRLARPKVRLTESFRADPQLFRQASNWLFWATIAGYVAMGFAGAMRGATPGEIISTVTSGDNYGGALKAQFAPITGVTTLTQVGIAYVIVGSILLRFRADKRAPRRLLIILCLGLLRSFLLNERLAILELAVPAAVVMAVGLTRSTGWPRTLVKFAPMFLLPALVSVFGAFEYFRSWTFYSTRTNTSIFTFMLDRIAGYYVTAYNNGQLTLDFGLYPGRLPYDSLKALWTAPGISSFHLYERLSGRDADQVYATVIEQHGNPEFNNPGGLVTPFIDFGSVGGVLALLLAGFLVGKLYRSMATDGLAGSLIYPVVVTGLFELPRYLYWTDGRVVPAMVALALFFWRLQMATRNAQACSVSLVTPTRTRIE